jgi:5-methyltetrahydrofolate--homocysteine methyltransferase
VLATELQMSTSILQSLRSQVLLADGAMGTELQQLGLEPGASAELWNVERPNNVADVHRAYVAAGAQLITTNTFRANRFALEHYGMGTRVREFNLAAVALAREAAGKAALVMGSVGPFGGFLEPLGEATAAEVFEAFAEQCSALVEGGVGAIIIETMTAPEELELAVRAANQAGAPLVFACFAFDRIKGGYATMMGTSPRAATEAALRSGADAIGCNCGSHLSLESLTEIIGEMRSSCDLPLIAQPNAGQPEWDGTEIIYQQGPEEMAAGLPRLIGAGANIVGGCCGTTPEHIRCFSQRVRLLKNG